MARSKPRRQEEWSRRKARLKRDGAWRLFIKKGLARKFGITVDQRDALFAQNGGTCHICNERPSTMIDHNHETDEVRGALCRACNTGLGALRDGKLFESAEIYLNNPPAREVK